MKYFSMSTKETEGLPFDHDHEKYRCCCYGMHVKVVADFETFSFFNSKINIALQKRIGKNL